MEAGWHEGKRGAVFVYFTAAVVASGALVLLRGIDTEDYSQQNIHVYHLCEYLNTATDVPGLHS